MCFLKNVTNVIKLQKETILQIMMNISKWVFFFSSSHQFMIYPKLQHFERKKKKITRHQKWNLN